MKKREENGNLSFKFKTKSLKSDLAKENQENGPQCTFLQQITTFWPLRRTADSEKICQHWKALEKLQEHQPREDQRTGWGQLKPANLRKRWFTENPLVMLAQWSTAAVNTPRYQWVRIAATTFIHGKVKQISKGSRAWVEHGWGNSNTTSLNMALYSSHPQTPTQDARKSRVALMIRTHLHDSWCRVRRKQRNWKRCLGTVNHVHFCNYESWISLSCLFTDINQALVGLGEAGWHHKCWNEDTWYGKKQWHHLNFLHFNAYDVILLCLQIW